MTIVKSKLSSGQMLRLVNDNQGSAYFVPKGYSCILIPEADADSVMRATKEGKSREPISVDADMEDCKLPQTILKLSADIATDPTRLPTRPQRLRRPSNPFILYGADKRKALCAAQFIDFPDISKLIAMMWRMEPNSVREHYFDLAAKLKAVHMEVYPDYKYKPIHKNKKTGSRCAPAKHKKTEEAQNLPNQ